MYRGEGKGGPDSPKGRNSRQALIPPLFLMKREDTKDKHLPLLHSLKTPSLIRIQIILIL